MDEKLNAVLKGICDNLTDEQKEKAKNCKTMEELTALAAKEGVELPDEALDAVAGGCDCGDCDNCPPFYYGRLTAPRSKKGEHHERKAERRPQGHL